MLMMLEMKTKNIGLELKIFPMQQITSPSSFKDQFKVYCLRSRDSIKPDVLEKKLGQSITSSVETNSGFWKIGESFKT